MKTNRWTGIGLCLTLLAAGVSCGDPATAPTQTGNVMVSLATPDPDDGVVLVALFGPGFGSVYAANASYRVFTLAASPTEMRVLVVGDLAPGPLLSVNVDDPDRIGEYHGTVVQVAARSDELRTVLAEYQVTFAAR